METATVESRVESVDGPGDPKAGKAVDRREYFRRRRELALEVPGSEHKVKADRRASRRSVDGMGRAAEVVIVREGLVRVDVSVRMSEAGGPVGGTLFLELCRKDMDRVAQLLLEVARGVGVNTSRF